MTLENVSAVFIFYNVNNDYAVILKKKKRKKCKKNHLAPYYLINSSVDLNWHHSLKIVVFVCFLFEKKNDAPAYFKIHNFSFGIKSILTHGII